MQRATTPKHIFVFDADPSEWKSFRITYKQNGRTVLEKTEENLNEMTISSVGGGKYRLEYMLTQEETKKFHTGQANVQVRVHYPSGKTPASPKFYFGVENVSNTEILK